MAAAKKALEQAPLLTEEQLLAMPAGDYMNDAQLAFFRNMLITTRDEMMAREREVKERLSANESIPDPADRASAEEEHWLDLRLREREAYLIRKIDQSLRLIDEGEYGFCEQSGEPIGIPRLLARPTATVSVDVKSIDEVTESHFADRG